MLLPHIVHIVADDLGWRYVDWHRNDKNESLTPHMHSLVRSGVELDRCYSFKFCSPSRSAVQTGRNPVSVNVQNVVPEVSNAADKVGGWQGIPTEMTGVASVLKRAGYATHAVGKWDVGMATASHHPRARGYDTWTGYWHHANDYWQMTEESCDGVPMADLWVYNATYDGPAAFLRNGPDCTQEQQSPAGQRCVYEEALLTERVLATIEAHATRERPTPLFLFWAMHLVHMPLQVPASYEARFASIASEPRRRMTAMVSYLDGEVGRVVAALQRERMVSDTLIVFHSDNGGEIMGGGLCGGNNWPLTGGKFSNFEGGIRVAAFVSGGFVPPGRRGTRLGGLVTIWDWFATFASIASVNATDERAAAARLPPVESVDQWGYISGASGRPPRQEVVIGDTTALAPNADGATRVGGLISGRWKILVGTADHLHTVSQYVMTGPEWPNVSSHLVPLLHPKTCGRSASRGCLFDIFGDPSERSNLALTNSSLWSRMLARVDELQAGLASGPDIYSPVRGKRDPRACAAAKARGGYWGPFAETQ